MVRGDRHVLHYIRERESGKAKAGTRIYSRWPLLNIGKYSIDRRLRRTGLISDSISLLPVHIVYLRRKAPAQHTPEIHSAFAEDRRWRKYC
ncbi:hypothetical protein X777_16970 [Ooceraea biroi]|uniref:Uncharacterized protein n=1 Tax=Ooceraea biroi TaxID=2015173 RepID=A0A026WSI3_OOCBI|nr:hypothetical protein X777_16970 [Ooceraea biroi]